MKNKDYISDEELIYYIRKNNKEAERLLFLRYEKKLGPLIYEYDYILTKQGYTHEDYRAILWEAIDRSVKSYIFLQSNFSTYCYSITRRTVVDLCRKNTIEKDWTRVELNSEEDAELINILADSSVSLYDKSFFEEVMKEVKSLGSMQYKIIKMTYEGYSYDEIGEKLGVSGKKVNNMLMAIRKHLKNRFS